MCEVARWRKIMIVAALSIAGLASTAFAGPPGRNACVFSIGVPLAMQYPVRVKQSQACHGAAEWPRARKRGANHGRG